MSEFDQPVPGRPGPGVIDQAPTHFDAKKRRAMARIAQSLQINPKPWGELVGVDVGKYDREDPSQNTALWNVIVGRLTVEQILPFWNLVGEAMSGGVQSTSEIVEGDPFAFFYTGVCQRHHEGTSITAEGVEEHEGELWYKQTAVIKTGHRIDQDEAEKMIAFLRAEDNIKYCEICKEEITTFSAEINRVSAFRAKEAVGTPMSPTAGFVNIDKSKP